MSGADEMPEEASQDPGELLARATALAEQVPADPAALPAEARGRAALLLREAIACLDAVLRCVPAGADRVPDAAFRTVAGRAIRDRRPGAFDVAMLQAQRNALARLLGQAEAVASAETLRLSATMADLARPLLETLAQAPEVFLAAVRPRPGDVARAFVPEVAEAAAQAYDALWRDLEPPRPEAGQTELRIVAAPAGLLASDNAFSAAFPTGYRAIAELLQPHRVWLRWQYVRPGAPDGLALDGLVWLDDHWAWFPRPHRALAAALGRS